MLEYSRAPVKRRWHATHRDNHNDNDNRKHGTDASLCINISRSEQTTTILWITFLIVSLENNIHDHIYVPLEILWA